MRRYFPLILVLTLSACTWVKVTESGKSVQVLDSAEASTCKPMTRITAMSRAKVAGISRNEEKLALELETIARNQAGGNGANAIAPVSDITGNERVYRAYRCD